MYNFGSLRQYPPRPILASHSRRPKCPRTTVSSASRPENNSSHYAPSRHHPWPPAGQLVRSAAPA